MITYILIVNGIIIPAINLRLKEEEQRNYANFINIFVLFLTMF